MPETRKETRDLYFPRFYTLLFPEQEWQIQGKEENQYEEICKEMQRDQSAVSENEEMQSEGDCNKAQSDTDWLLPLLWNH